MLKFHYYHINMSGVIQETRKSAISGFREQILIFNLIAACDGNSCRKEVVRRNADITIGRIGLEERSL